MESNQNLLNNELIIDTPTASHLKETAMWARFLGVLGIILSILVFLGAVFLKYFIEEMGGLYGSGFRDLPDSAATMISVIYGIVALVIFFASFAQYKFGAKAKRALLSMDQESLRASFLNLKIYYRIVGILTILWLLLVLLSLITMVTMGRHGGY